jgi:hypothetical protein
LTDTSDTAQSRKTTLTVATILLLLAAWSYHRGRLPSAEVLAGVGGTLLLVGFLLPPWAHRFHVAWMRLATAIGYVNSRVLLALLYFGIFAPYGLLLRLIGRDPLNRRGQDRHSYWVSRQSTRQAREQFERQF